YQPDHAGDLTARDRILAERRPDRTLFDDLERSRQRAGPEHQGKVPRLLERRVPELDLAALPDAALHDGRAVHLIVQDDGDLLADGPAGGLFKGAPAPPVQLEGDDGLVGLLAATGGRVDQVLTGHERRVLEYIEHTVELGGDGDRVGFPANRDAAGQCR